MGMGVVHTCPVAGSLAGIDGNHVVFVQAETFDSCPADATSGARDECNPAFFVWETHD